MDGIIPLWKERNMTSHDCVFKLRKILKTKKIGHTGTLDPNVDGVLPICVGKATKLVEMMMDKQKTYIGEITFGFATDTEDLDGQIIEQKILNQPLTRLQLKEGMEQLTGEIVQIPPMYSAVKVKGKRLYEYARQNQLVERPERHVFVYRFEATSDLTPISKKGTQSFRFIVECGKGTYIRTLASDLGSYFDIPATMTDLTRLAVTPFHASECFTMETIAQMMEDGKTDFLLNFELPLQHLPIWTVPQHLVKLVNNGAVLQRSQLPEQLPVRAYIAGQLKAIYIQHPQREDQVKPSKMF